MTKEDYRTVGRNADGSMMARTWLLHIIGKVTGVQFHVGGWPYGASYRRSITWMPSDGEMACANPEAIY